MTTTPTDWRDPYNEGVNLAEMDLDEALEYLSEKATWHGQDELDSIVWAEGYAEPGYSLAEGKVGVVLANWNEETKYDPVTGPKVVDSTMKWAAVMLEKRGYSTEWSDEWEQCDECGKIFRTTASYYGWKLSGWIDEGGSAFCRDCLDIDEYLEFFVGKTWKAVSLDDIDLTAHGFVEVKRGMQRGLHEGQAANPDKIGRVCRQVGIDRFLFRLDDSGQFDVEFSLWVDRKTPIADVARLEEALSSAENVDDEVSPAETVKRALKGISQIPAKPGKIQYSEIEVHNDGSSRTVTRDIDREEFVKGINSKKTKGSDR
jgi:hypothetical protein